MCVLACGLCCGFDILGGYLLNICEMTKTEQKAEMTNDELEDYDDDYCENQPYESCPKCGRSYDDIDFDYQSCSKCGWDAEKETFGESREPTDEDFMNGDADLLTGQWY